MPVPEFYLAENDKLRDKVQMLNRANTQLAHTLRVSLEESARLESANQALNEEIAQLKAQLSQLSAEKATTINVVILPVEEVTPPPPFFNANSAQKSGLALYSRDSSH